MAKPQITPTSVEANSASGYDLSALTSPGGVFSSSQGFVGSDFMFMPSWNGVNRYKTDGGGQLIPSFNAIGGGGNNSLKNVAWTQADEINGSVSGSGSPGCGVQNMVVGDWAQWASIIADQRTRMLHWRGANNACGPVGTLTVTATLGDGSATMAPFNIASGTTGFGILFVAGASPKAPTNLTVRVTCAAAPAGAAFFFNQIAWLDLPTGPGIPRGAKRYFMGRSLGSPLTDLPWFKVGVEGASVTLPSASNLRYGAPRSWVSKNNVVGTFTVGSAFFGSDPNPGAGASKQAQTTNPAYRTQDVKVMPVGDSITGFYTQALWTAIGGAGFTHTDFIGNAPYSFSDSYDLDSNGYGGYACRDLLNPVGSGTKLVNSGNLYNGDAGDLKDWMTGTFPDIVLLHIGTNDGGSADVTGCLAAYSLILAAVRARNPNVRFFVAQIIPASGNLSWSATLNASIPAWASANSTVASPVTVVDQWTGFNAATMTVDGTHPNATGASHMTAAWMAAISAYLR